MEEVKKIDTLVFDKTGILAWEQPEVGDILVFDDMRPEVKQVIRYLRERGIKHIASVTFGWAQLRLLERNESRLHRISSP